MDSPVIQDLKIQKRQSIDKIEDKNQQQDQNKGQVSRRSRKDTDGRDFKCGCGKKYLSYPALYTHIKTKHEGHQPQGTVKYSTTVPAKKTKSKIQQQNLVQVYSLVKKEDVRLLNLLGQNFQGFTPLSLRIKNKILSKDITDSYSTLLKNATTTLKLGLQNNLEQHLIVYLIGVGQFIGQKLHEQYQWFARSVRQCYYQIGNEVYNKCFSKKQGGIAYIPKFRVDQVKYFPIISDFYIRFFLPFQYMDLNLDLMQLILVDFCQWLLKRGSTLIQTILNKQYKLNVPLQFQQDSKNQKDNKNQEEQDHSDLDDIQPDFRQEKIQQSQQQVKISAAQNEQLQLQVEDKFQENNNKNSQQQNALNLQIQNHNNNQKHQHNSDLASILKQAELIVKQSQQNLYQASQKINKQNQQLIQQHQIKVNKIIQNQVLQQKNNEQ